jgi:hypothetical protein
MVAYAMLEHGECQAGVQVVVTAQTMTQIRVSNLMRSRK